MSIEKVDYEVMYDSLMVRHIALQEKHLKLQDEYIELLQRAIKEERV